ncbi:uncharacterized protein LOC111878983 [Lactuca sativa]|uniref:uncharacterized protein LOC111878983 n=1 Tax=Lactuca sativa TaxID=4236 RepID=UPI000CD93709|nr:uncharacterized protein LOC111878983 [Lactuca sativa]
MGSTEVVFQTTELIQQVCGRLQIVQSRRKSYADRHRSYLEVQVGDMVLLKVSPWKVVIWLRKRGKQGPIYIGPFKVIAWVDRVAYRLKLPEELNQIHITFHVSQLWKCLVDDSIMVSLEEIHVDECMNYIEIPIAILDRKTKTLQNKEVGLLKVQRQHQKGSKWT